MNQQEGAGAGTLSGLCAGRTMIESKSLWKHQQEHCCGGVGGGGLASARLIATLFAILFGANLNYESLQSLETKPRN